MKRAQNNHLTFGPIHDLALGNSLTFQSSQKKAVIYTRVSTDTQDESSQIEMGKQVAEELGYSKEQIQVIIDHGVSARKVKVHGRVGLVQAMKQATSGDVSVMIVRDRDRIARNMIEYLDIWQKLEEVGVSLVLSDKGATPVSNNFGEEALNALMAEIEGDKIAARTRAASRFYPPAPLGYKRVGRKGNTHYEFTEIINDIKDLFKDFQTVTSKEQYMRFRSYWKRQIGRFPDKILQNLLYAAAIPDGDDVKTVYHVKPIVEVITILENQQRLKDWGYAEKNKQQIEPLKVFVPLYCNQCGAEMGERGRKGVRIFACPNCRVVRYEEHQILDVIVQTIQGITLSLDESEIQQRVLSKIRMYKSRRLKEAQELWRKRLKKGREILDALEFGSIETLLKEYRSLENSLQATFQEICCLANLALSVLDLRDEIKMKIRQRSEHCAESIQQLLIHHVVLDVGVIDVYHRFADFSEKEVFV